jgi:hypothetical protein
MDLSDPKVREEIRLDADMHRVRRNQAHDMLDHVEAQEKRIAELEEKLTALEAMHPYAA